MCVLFQVVYHQKAELNRETVFPMHPSSINGVEDMSTLAELHEAAIMHNLFLRYQKDNIYVRHRTVLICENIYRTTMMYLQSVGPLCCSGVYFSFFWEPQCAARLENLINL